MEENMLDFLFIDNEQFNVKVYTGINRTADVLDKYAVRTEDGNLNREIIGVYVNFDNIKFDKQKDSNYNEYNRLWNKLTEPVEFHTIQLGYDEPFIAYISSVSDTVYKIKNNKTYHKNLTCKFICRKPTKS